MCLGDEVIFTCTTVSQNQSLLILYWINPDDINDRVLYYLNSIEDGNDFLVGSFATALEELSDDTIVSTATIKEVNFVNSMPAGIICRDSISNEKKLYVYSGMR